MFTLFQSYISSREDYLTLYQKLLEFQMPAVVENIVSSHLCKYFSNSFFYQNKTGEVDFVGQKNDDFFAFEIKYKNDIQVLDFKLSKLFKNFCLISKNKFILEKDYQAVPFLWLLVNLDKSYVEEN